MLGAGAKYRIYKDGKGKSIWDTFAHTEGKIKNKLVILLLTIINTNYMKSFIFYPLILSLFLILKSLEDEIVYFITPTEIKYLTELDKKVIDDLNDEGWPVSPGDLGENITTAGLNQNELYPGNKIKIGNAMSLNDIPPGTLVHNVELIEGNGGKLARSAGSSVTISGFDNDYAIIKLSSGETRKVRASCKATIGTVSNPDQKNIQIGKAGRNRWKGKRPMVRGVVKNPVDHPHGGGEGKSAGGRHPVSPWGQSAKGLKTRKPKRSDKFIISRRKKRNKR